MAGMSKLRWQAALKPLYEDPTSLEETVKRSDSQGYGEARPSRNSRAAQGKKKKAAASNKTVTIRGEMPVDTYMPLKRESMDTETPIPRLVCDMIENAYGRRG